MTNVTNASELSLLVQILIKKRYSEFAFTCSTIDTIFIIIQVCNGKSLENVCI